MTKENDDKNYSNSGDVDNRSDEKKVDEYNQIDFEHVTDVAKAVEQPRSRPHRSEIKLSSLFFSGTRQETSSRAQEASPSQREGKFKKRKKKSWLKNRMPNKSNPLVSDSILAEVVKEASLCRALISDAEVTKASLDELEKITRALQRQNILLNRQVASGLTEMRKYCKSGEGSSVDEQRYGALLVSIESQQKENVKLSEKVSQLFQENSKVTDALNKVNNDANLALERCQVLDNYLVNQQGHDGHTAMLTESELINIKDNTAQIQESHDALQRQLIAVEAMRDSCLRSEVKLSEECHAALEQLTTMQHQVEKEVTGAQKAADSAERSCGRAEEVAKTSLVNLQRVIDYRNEVSDVVEECRSLYEQSKVFAASSAAVLKSVDNGQYIFETLKTLDDEIKAVLDEVVAYQGRSETLEREVKEHFDQEQSALDQVLVLSDQIDRAEKRTEDQHTKVNVAYERLEQRQAELVDLQERVSSELNQTREVRKQMLTIKDHAQALLLDFRDSLKESPSSDLYDASELDAFLNEVRVDHAEIKGDIASLKEALQGQQDKMDLIISDQSEKNRDLFSIFEQYQSEHLLTPEELKEARALLHQLRGLSEENRAARASVEALSVQVNQWSADRGPHQKGTGHQFVAMQETLKALEERQSLMDFVTKDSERLNKLMNHAVDECQLLNERVDNIIEESLKQQEQFRDDAEAVLARAEGHEQRIDEMSSKNDEVVQTIEEAQLQAQAAALESVRVLESMQSTRDVVEASLKECQALCDQNSEIKNSAERLIREASENIVDDGVQLNKKTQNLQTKLDQINQKIKGTLSQCEDKLQCILELEAAAQHQRSTGDDCLSRASELLSRIERGSEDFQGRFQDGEMKYESLLADFRDVVDQMHQATQQFDGAKADLAQRFESHHALQASIAKMKEQLHGLFDQCQVALNGVAQKEEALEEVLENQRQHQSKADMLFDQCETLNQSSARINDEQSERMADLYALAEQLRAQQGEANALIQMQSQRNGELETLLESVLEKVAQGEGQVGAVEQRVETSLADLSLLTQANKRAQKVLSDNIRFVRALQKRVNSNSDQNEAICGKFSEYDAELTEKNRVLEQLSQETLQLQTTMKDRFADHTDQMELLLLKGEAHDRDVSEGIDRSAQAAALANKSCKEVKRLAQQTQQRLTMMDALQEKADQALQAYDLLAEENRSNQALFNAMLKDLLRHRAKSVTLQLQMRKDQVKSDETRQSVDDLKGTCETLLRDSRQQVTKGDVQMRKIESLESRIELLLQEGGKIHENSVELHRDTQRRHEEQAKQYSNIIDLTQKLAEQQKQNERIIAQHSTRTAALDEVIQDQAALIREKQEASQENERLREKVDTVADMGKRTARIVVQHIHQMRSVGVDIQERSDALFKQHESMDALERSLEEKSDQLAVLLDKTESLRKSAEANVEHCQQINASVEQHVHECRQESDAIREMAQTTRQFEQSCYEIKAGLESESEKICTMRSETQKWVHETELNLTKALDENQKVLEDTQGSNGVLERRLREHEVDQQRLKALIAQQSEQLAAAGQQLERWQQRWEGVERWQGEQEALIKKTRAQLNDTIDHAQRLQANVEEKEQQNRALNRTLETLSEQAQKQQKTIEAAEALAKRSEAREARLETQLKESVALNRALSERLSALEPYTLNIKTALQSAEKFAEEAGIANKEIDVTHRELQVAFNEIKNELKTLQLKVEEKRALDPVPAPSYQSEERKIENRDIRESLKEYDPLEEDASELPGVEEPYIVSPITGEDRSASGERSKKSFKSFLY